MLSEDDPYCGISINTAEDYQAFVEHLHDLAKKLGWVD